MEILKNIGSLGGRKMEFLDDVLYDNSELWEELPGVGSENLQVDIEEEVVDTL